MKLFNRELTSTQPPYIIADIGLCHDGLVSNALSLINKAADIGVDCVKFQKRTVDLLAIPEVLDASVNDPRFPDFKGTYRELRQQHEFDRLDYNILKSATESRGMDFLVTPFDIPAVKFLEELGVKAYKVASHSVTNTPLLEYIASLGKPVIMSTGMSDYIEIIEAVRTLLRAGLTHDTIALLHCVSAYPTSHCQANIAAIQALKAAYPKYILGYSGHEQGYDVTLAAVACGAQIVERHITYDTEAPGFDHALALEPEQFRDMIERIQEVWCMRGTGELRIYDHEKATRHKYRLSIAAKETIPAGEVLTRHRLYLTNPGTGLHPQHLTKLAGMKAQERIPARTLITWEQVK